MQAISVRKTKPQRGKNHSEGAIYFQASVFLQHKGNKLITLYAWTHEHSLVWTSEQY